MCKFFSILSDAKGNYYYADAELRKQFSNENCDSHSWLANHFLKNGAEDKLNAYEFNPLTKVLVKDKLNTEDDSLSVEEWCNEIDWKRIVPQLIVKEIVHPFKLKKRKPTKKDIADLKEWASVWDSVRDSVGDSVCDSVGDSVGDSVCDSVGDSVCDSVLASVWDSVLASVRASVGASVWDSVRASVWDSVLASVWAYYSSFFDMEYKYDFSSLNRLWNKGFLPSFDGKKWRLHSGEKAEVVWEGSF
jgi:hypothetical protein